MDPLGIFDRAKSALAEIQISEVLKERLEFAIDQGAATETKVAELRAEIADVKAELKIANLDAKKKQLELDELKERHKEEVRTVSGVEFRRGERTNGSWQPFCPKCHLPLILDMDEQFPPACSDQDCHWTSQLYSRQISRP